MNLMTIQEIGITIVASLGSLMLVTYLFNKTGGKLASRWVKKEFEVLEDFNIILFFETIGNSDDSKDIYERIKRQYLQAKVKAIQHFNIIKHFQVRYYTVINLTAICGILSAIFAFIIMNTGWDGSHVVMRTLFFVFSSTTTYCAAFPRFFSYKMIISNNKAKSLKYRHLMNRIETFLHTGYDSTFEKTEIESFIVMIDRDFEKLFDYPINFEMDVKFNPDNVFNRLK